MSDTASHPPSRSASPSASLSSAAAQQPHAAWDDHNRDDSHSRDHSHSHDDSPDQDGFSSRQQTQDLPDIPGSGAAAATDSETADAERRITRFGNFSNVRAFTTNYDDDKDHLQSLWQSAFNSFDRLAPYECDDVPRGKFLPLTKPDIFIDLLRDPDSLTTDQLYALTANTAAALKSYQDEFFAIDSTVKLATRRFQKRLPDPRAPDSAPDVWEDKKEALLYGFKHDPNQNLIGCQDPFLQGGFRPTAAQARRMKEKARDPNNVDEWSPILRDGHYYLPATRNPTKPHYRRKYTPADINSKTVTRSSSNTAGETVEARAIRKTRFGGGRHPAVTEKIEKSERTTTTTRTKSGGAGTHPAPTRGRRGRPTNLELEAKRQQEKERQKGDAAEAASILTAMNETAASAAALSDANTNTARNAPLAAKKEKREPTPVINRDETVPAKPKPTQTRESQPPVSQTAAAAAAAASSTAPPSAAGTVTAPAPVTAPATATATPENTQSPKPTLPLGNPLLDPKNQEKIRLSKNPKRTEAMIMHWAKFNSEGRMRNPKRTKAQIEAAKGQSSGEGPSKPGRKRKARAGSELPLASTTAAGEESSTNKRQKPSSPSLPPPPPTGPFSVHPPDPNIPYPSDALPASAPLPPHHHPRPPPLQPPPTVSVSRHFPPPPPGAMHHPQTPISLPPPQAIPRNNPHQITHFHPPQQAPPPYSHPASAPHVMYPAREGLALPPPPPFHLPPSVTAPGPGAGPGPGSGSGSGSVHTHHHHHHPQYPPGPSTQNHMQYPPGY